MARKQQTGTVLKDQNDKSIVVGVSWLQRDRIYKKARRKITKFVVHDESNKATVGDRVLIEQSRPISKTKRWRLVDVLDRVEVWVRFNLRKSIVRLPWQVHQIQQDPRTSLNDSEGDKAESCR
ncbi:MAG: hypothetical protein CM1200mP39_18220 [Dehalococcoidia bacterium]|nr:MAG: hypothetical protein CM1200mP39_18220 [Dehalococcoidia bacterium]